MTARHLISRNDYAVLRSALSAGHLSPPMVRELGGCRVTVEVVPASTLWGVSHLLHVMVERGPVTSTQHFASVEDMQKYL